MKVDSPLCSEPPCAGGSRLQRLNAAVKKRSAGAQILLSEHMQSLWHSYKPLTRPDRGSARQVLSCFSQFSEHGPGVQQCAGYRTAA